MNLSNPASIKRIQEIENRMGLNISKERKRRQQMNNNRRRRTSNRLSNTNTVSRGSRNSSSNFYSFMK